jgi:hypothetical protein
LLNDPINGSFEQKLTEIENNYTFRITELEKLTGALRNMLNELELSANQKLAENERLKLDYESQVREINVELEKSRAQVKQLNEQLLIQNKDRNKTYQPINFAESRTLTNDEDLHNALFELNFLQKKFNKCSRELDAYKREYESKLREQRLSYEKKLAESTRKHQLDVQALIKLMVIGSNENDEEDEVYAESDYFEEARWFSPLDDPNQMKFMLKLRARYMRMNRVIDRQKQLIDKLNEQLKANHSSADKADKLQKFNIKLAKKIEALSAEISELKRSQTPSASEFNALREKLKWIEQSNLQRSLELKELLGTKSRSSPQFDFYDDESQFENIISMYQKQLRQKDEEIEKFKVELDSMLRILHTLRLNS